MMRNRTPIVCAALWCTLAAPPATAKAPSCDECRDLPRLYRELLEQEFLRKLFDSWIKQSYYPGTVGTMQKAAQSQLNAAMQGNLYGPLAGAQGGGGGDGGAAPAYGTNLNSKACQLVEYYVDKDGEEQQRPVTPEQVRARHCPQVADFVLAHEQKHQEKCRSSWKETGSDKFITVEYIAADDREAYQTGIAVLRQHIAKLARDCGWGGSTNARKPDGTMTVPTPQEILELKDKVKRNAGKLQRSSK
jgi:hypothetical protein